VTALLLERRTAVLTQLLTTTTGNSFS
jgi:hypothetical protein